MAELPFQHDKDRQFVIIDEHHTISDEALAEFAIQSGVVNVSKLEPVGDMIADALGNIVIDSSSTACTNRPSCNCPKCQTRLNKMLKDHAKRIEYSESPLNRAQRRKLEKRNRRKRP